MMKKLSKDAQQILDTQYILATEYALISLYSAVQQLATLKVSIRDVLRELALADQDTQDARRPTTSEALDKFAIDHAQVNLVNAANRLLALGVPMAKIAGLTGSKPHPHIGESHTSRE